MISDFRGEGGVKNDSKKSDIIYEWSLIQMENSEFGKQYWCLYELVFHLTSHTHIQVTLTAVGSLSVPSCFGWCRCVGAGAAYRSRLRRGSRACRVILRSLCSTPLLAHGNPLLDLLDGLRIPAAPPRGGCWIMGIPRRPCHPSMGGVLELGPSTSAHSPRKSTQNMLHFD